MEAISIELNCIVKAVRSNDGRRLVEVQASSEDIDLEGDIILQKALLDSADSFIARGHIDIDHISEIGKQIGIPNPESFIIGKPLEVKNLGKGRTGVVSEIMRSMDGKVDIVKNRYDSFWESLNSQPSVRWRSSVYGYPKADMVSDCRQEACEVPAKRYLVRGMDWRSLAMTRKPINDAITGFAKVINKAMLDEIRKEYSTGAMGLGVSNPMDQRADVDPDMHEAPYYPHITPKSINELWGQYDLHMAKDCPHVMGLDGRPFNTTAGFADHFQNCCGASKAESDVLSHALAYLMLRRRNSNLI